MKGTNVYQNTALKSHYCLEELKKQEGEYLPMYGRKRDRSKNSSHSTNPRVEPEVKRNENHCDVTFLRKLLAMNKKEELVLNRKLAKLVLEEEFGFENESSSLPVVTKTLFSNTAVSNFDSRNERKFPSLNENKVIRHKVNHPLGCTIDDKTKNISKRVVRAQYDLNGRRIYYDSENYEESECEDTTSTVKYSSGSEDEHSNPSVKFTRGSSKTYINTTTVIQTKSDITCDSSGRGKISSRRNSMTFMNQPVLDMKEHRVRRTPEGGTEDDSKYKKCLFTKVDASGKGSPSHGRRESSPGDGVQNVVVHCCEVAKDKVSSESKKKVLKVWNFNDIPKIQTVKLDTSNVKTLHDTQKIKESSAMSNKEKEVKNSRKSKDDRSAQQPSATQTTFVKRKSRSNNVC